MRPQSGQTQVKFRFKFGSFCVVVGSGSTYIYGHCDATFKTKMTKDDCFKFVANGKSYSGRGYVAKSWLLQVKPGFHLS